MLRSNVPLLLPTAAAIVVLGVATPVFAQIQERQPPPQRDRSVVDPEPADIVVTAQKREERILDIPQSVSVVGGDTLERQQANTFQEYTNLVPGLSITESNPGNTTIILRGVNTGGVSSTVAVYLDETPFGSSSGLVNGSILAGDFDTFDVTRLEVLRGPQGTLYGASSLGGVVKFVTNTPKLGELSARGRAGAEFVDGGDVGWNGAAVANIPLGDKLALRATGFYRRDGGWIDATQNEVFIGSAGSLAGKNINDTTVKGGRASLIYKPIDPLTIRLSAYLQDIDTNASSLIEVDPVSYKPVSGLRQVRWVDAPRDTRYRLYNGVLEYELGFASLLSSTSYGELKQRFTADLTTEFGNLVTSFFGDPSSQPLGALRLQRTDGTKFTQEVRLSSPSDTVFEWMVGGYYTREKGEIVQAIPAYDLLGRREVTRDELPLLADLYIRSKYEEYAGFSNVTFHATDRLHLTVGGRVSRNSQVADQGGEGPLFGDPVLFPTSKSSETVFTYSVAPRFEISSTTSIYARVASGYRPGGPNVLPPGAPEGAPRTYSADRLTSYEVGLKSDIGRRLSIDLAAYLLKWKDVQLFAFINDVGVNANGGKATVKGFEGTITYRPVRGLEFSANGAVTDGKLDEDAPEVVGGFRGDPLPWSPRTSVSLNGDYEWALTTTARAYLGASVRYVGRQFGDFDLAYRSEFGRQRRIPTYTTVDFRAGVQFGRFGIEAFARNVTNARGLLTASLPTDFALGTPSLPNGALSAAIIRPRTIGVSLGAQF